MELIVLMSEALKDIPKMFWGSKEFIISLVTLYLIIWFNRIPKIKDREDLLRARLMEGRPTLQTKFGTFYTYFVKMRERRGFKYKLKKLFLWRVEGDTEIYMYATDPHLSVRDQLSEFKRDVEEKFKVKVDFLELENGQLVMSLKIPSVDAEKCTEIWQGMGGILKQEEPPYEIEYYYTMDEEYRSGCCAN
jgi:hypothetical protein